jgi:hypothetical protein
LGGVPPRPHCFSVINTGRCLSAESNSPSAANLAVVIGVNIRLEAKTETGAWSQYGELPKEKTLDMKANKIYFM